MKRKLLFVSLIILSFGLVLSARGVLKPIEKSEQVPSDSSAYTSYINIDLDAADQYDYAHVHYKGTTTDCGSTDGWYDIGNYYFDNNGNISINLGYPFGYIEAIVTVYINGYPDCPYTIQQSVGTSCSTTMRNLTISFNPVYPWECPD